MYTEPYKNLRLICSLFIRLKVYSLLKYGESKSEELILNPESLVKLQKRCALEGLKQASTHISLPITIGREHGGQRRGLNLTCSRLDHVLDLQSALLICVNGIIFPVIVPHKLGVGVQAAPSDFIAGEDLLDVFVVLSCPSLVL